MTRLPLLLPLLLAALSGCGGMTRTVGVLPNTLDDLSAKTEPFRRNRDAPRPAPDPAPLGF